MSAKVCLDEATLTRFLLGELTSTKADEVVRHLSVCSECLQTVQTMQTRDVLTDALRHGSRLADSPDELADELVAKLCTFRPMDRETTLDPSKVASGADTNTDSTPRRVPTSPDAREEYAFLAPAGEANELGRLGEYRVLRVLGRGGMGVVFEAYDPQLERCVALKAMRTKDNQSPSPKAKARFLREARAIAAIEHDHIVPIYQVGTQDEVPYLAMPLLKGHPLSHWLEGDRRLNVDQILRIGREVAQGLAAAHDRGLIHRDIKPSNLWLEPEQGGRIKILDFGLARSVGSTEEAASESELTETGAILGTPGYMSPEQARGEAVDARSDLFSLGCVLYLLCTGRKPFTGSDTMSVLMALAVNIPPSPRELNPAVPEPLSKLILQLLAKDPNARPQSAKEVVAALRTVERERQTPPVRVAKPVEQSVASPSRRWVVGTVVLVLLLGLGALALFQGPTILRYVTDQGVVVIETDDDVSVQVAKGKVTLSDTKGEHEIELRAGPHELEVTVKDPNGQVRFFTKRFDLSRGGQTVINVKYELAQGKKPKPKDETKKTEPDGPEHSLREYVPEKWELAEVQRFTGHEGMVQCVACSPDGRYAVSGGGDKTVRIWDLRRELLVQTLRGHEGWVLSVAVSPDGRFVLSGSDDKSIRLWELATGKQVYRVESAVAPWNLAFSPDGSAFVTEGNSKVWETQSGRIVRQLPRPVSTGVDFTPDGGTLFTGGFGESIPRLIDFGTGKTEYEFPRLTDGIRDTVVTPDGRFGVCSQGNSGNFDPAPKDSDFSICVFDLKAKRKIHRLQGHTHVPFSIAISPCGRTLVSGSLDKTVRLWDLDTGKEVGRFAGHQKAVWGVCYHPDGRRVITASLDGTIRVLRLIPKPKQPLELALKRVFYNKDHFTCLAVAADGQTAISGGFDGNVRLWDLATGKQMRELVGHPKDVLSVAISPDGRLALTGAKDESVRLWDLTTGKQKTQIDANGWGAFFSPDGKHFVLTNEDGLWDSRTGKRVQRFDSPLDKVAFLPDGKRLVSGHYHDREIRLVDVETGRILHRFPKHTDPVRDVAVSADGRYAISSHGRGVGGSGQPPPPGGDFSICLWDLQDRCEVRRFYGHSNSAYQIDFSPDGRWMVSASFDRTVRLWDVQTGRELCRYTDHSRELWGIAFCPDGKHIVSASVDGTMRLLEIGPTPPISLSQIRSFVGHRQDIHSVAITPDGNSAVSGSSDGTVRVWDLLQGNEVGRYRGHAEEVFAVAVSPDGKRVLSAGGGRYKHHRWVKEDHTIHYWDLESRERIHRFRGHTDIVHGVAFSPDGEFALSASRDGSVRFWDLVNNTQLAELRGHTDTVSKVNFSPDGRWAVSCAWDKTARLWDLDQRIEIRQFADHSDAVVDAQFTPDGQSVVTASLDRTVRVWSVPTGELVTTIPHPTGVMAIAISKDGKRVFTASGSEQVGNLSQPAGLDSHVRLFELATGKELGRIESPFGSLGIRVHPDERFVLTCGRDEKLRLLWLEDRETAKQTARDVLGTLRFEWEGPPLPILVCEDTKLVSVLDPQTVDVMALPPGQYQLAIDDRDGRFQRSHQEITVLSNRETTVRWKQAPFQDPHPRGFPKPKRLRVLPDSVWCVASTKDGTRILSTEGNGTVRVLDSTTGKDVCEPIEQPYLVHSAAFTPDGKRVLIGLGEPLSEERPKGWVRLWDIDAGREVQTFQGNRFFVWDVAISHDGTRAASADDAGTVHLWDIATGKLLTKIEAHDWAATRVAFVPNTDACVSCSWDGTVRLWNIQTGKLIREFDGHTYAVRGLSVSPDGKQLLTSGEDKTVRLWEIASGKQLRVLRHPSGVNCVAFTPDGKRAITGSGSRFDPLTSRAFEAGYDNTVRLWDLSRAKVTAHFEGHTNVLMGIAISHAGPHVLSCGVDRTIQVLTLP